MTEYSDLDGKTSEEIENLVLDKQNELNEQSDRLGEVLNAITKNKTEYGELKDKQFKAEEVIRRTKVDIKNLEFIFKWRSLKRERGH